MKMKKLLAGVLAGAMAVSAVTFTSITTNAANEIPQSKVLYDGDEFRLIPYDDQDKYEGSFNKNLSLPNLTSSDLTTYRNLEFTITFDDEAVNYLNNNQWKAGHLFQLGVQANDKYDASWPGFDISAQGDISIDAYASMPVPNAEIKVKYSTSNFLTGIEEKIKDFDFDAHFANLFFNAGWAIVTIKKVSLVDPNVPGIEYKPVSATIDELEVVFSKNEPWNWQGVKDFTFEGSEAFVGKTLSNLGISTLTVKFTAASAISDDKAFDLSKIKYQLNLNSRVGENYKWIAIGKSTYNSDTQEVTITANVENDAPSCDQYDANAEFVGFQLIAMVEFKDATAPITLTIGKKAIPLTGITLNKTAHTLTKGETAELSVTEYTPEDTTDEKTVTWKSSNEDAVIVDESGKVTAVAKGTATITATSTANPEVKAECEVTVNNPELESIAFKQSEIALLVGGEATVECTYLPTDADKPAIKITSSDDSIKVTDNGDGKAKVEGVKATSTPVEITATVEGATSIAAATCKVTVSDKAIPATGVKLNEETLELTAGDKPTQLIPTLISDEGTPTDTITKTEWTSSEPTIAAVNKDGNVTAVAEGKATITVKVNDNFTATCKVTVKKLVKPISEVVLDKTSATVEEGKTVEIKATVNPSDTTEDKTVTWTSSDEKVATVKDGVVTAVAEGKATITAEAGTKKATCEITVTKKAEEPAPSVNSIELNQKLNKISDESDSFTEILNNTSEKLKDIDLSSVKSVIFNLSVDPKDWNWGWNNGAFKVISGETETIRKFGGTSCAGNDWFPEDSVIYQETDTKFAVAIAVEKFDPNNFSLLYNDNIADVYTLVSIEFSSDNLDNPDKPDEPDKPGETTHKGSVTLEATQYDGWYEKTITIEELLGNLDRTKAIITFSGSALSKVGYNSVSAKEYYGIELKAPDTTITVNASDIDFENYFFHVGGSAAEEITWIATADGGDTPDVPDDTTTDTSAPTPSVPGGSFTVPGTAETTTSPDTTTPPAAEGSVTPETTQLVNGDSTVKVEFAAGSVKTGAALDVKKGAETATSATYDITLKLANAAIQPDGTLTITISVPANLLGADNYYVYRAETDGSYTDMMAAYADGKVTFKTGHLSEYVISTVKLTDTGIADGSSSDSAQNPDEGIVNTGNADSDTTGENTGSTDGGKNDDKNVATGAALALVPAAAAAAAVIISKKRK